MESWQVSHIQKNLVDLSRFTNCNSSFIAHLQKRDVLSVNDISRLEAKRRSDGVIAESSLLYEILITRSGAYDALTEALRETAQTGSLKILEQACSVGKRVCIKVECITKSTTWNELSDSLKSELEKKLVEYQNGTVTLDQLAKHHDLGKIDEDILVELAEGKMPTVVNNQVPDPLHYYVHRTIESRNRLKSKVFQHVCNDVFVVQGVERKELSCLAGDCETDVSGNQIHRLSVRFILLEYEGDFEAICKLASEPVHWIKYHEKSYEWVKSSGSVINLQNYVHDSQVQFGEDELGIIKNKVIVISDSPGMGKTMLLVNIANVIMKRDSTTFIRFIILKEMVQTLENKQIKINLDTIVSFIAEQSSAFEFGRKLVENVIKSSPCVLIFDGFDEVLSHQIKTANQILKEVSTLESVKLFVTTRPHMRELLENSLQVFGYTIQPFDESNQLSFILKFWESKGVENNESVEKFAKSCLHSLNREMSDFENQIAGIPLQCKMLAEAYKTHAMRCSKIGHEAYQSDLIRLSTSVFEMYQRHMSMRFERICRTSSFLKRVKLFKGSKEKQYEAIKRVHTYFALKLLFPKQADEFKSLNDASISKSQVCGLGLLEGTYSKYVRFVHRTFAEYLVAWFVVEKCVGRKKFLLSEIFSTISKDDCLPSPVTEFEPIQSFRFKFPVICYFINGFIKRKYQPESEENNFTNYLRYSQVAPIVFASVSHNYSHLLLGLSKLFGNQTNTNQDTQTLEMGDLLLITAKYADVELMKIFCENVDIASIQFRTSSVGSFTITPLQLAIQRGHYNLVEYLMKQYNNNLIKLPYLVHYCVHQSQGDGKATISSKIQIMKLLFTKSKQWLDELLPNSTVPLVQTNVDLELLECLIEEGANVNVFDNNDYTVLHHIVDTPKLTPEDYDRITQALVKRGFNLFNKHAMRLYSLTPLHYAVNHLELLESTLQLFYSNGADFNAISNYFCANGRFSEFDSVLFHAIWAGRSVRLIKALIDHGADWRYLNKAGQGVVHICATQGHLEALKYFIETHKMDVNEQACNLATPLHCAVLKRSENHELVQRYLIGKGADVNAKTGHNLTPFMHSLEVGEGLTLAVIQLMKQHGLLINGGIADEALMAALTNTTLKLDNEVAEVLDYLYWTRDRALFCSKISWNPWTFEKVRKTLPEIIQSTTVTSQLLHEAKEYHLLSESELKELAKTSESLKSERFYELVQKNNTSFQSTCMSLLYGNQFHAYVLLKNYNDEGNIFDTAPPGVSQFTGSEDTKVMILLSKYVDLTISRIKETVDSLIPEIGESTLRSQLPVDKLTIFQCQTATKQLITKLEAMVAPKGKVICICSEMNENMQNCDVFKDTFGWEDISWKFSRLFSCTFGFNNLNFCDMFVSPEIVGAFGTWILLTFRYGKGCILTEMKVGHPMKEKEGNFLSTKLFHHFLRDKLLFFGITETELKKFAKYGQRIGYAGEDVDKLDYVIVESLQRIEEICNKADKNVHLIEYREGDFILVRTVGDDSKIKEFIEKPPICENFPACGCESGYENVVFKCSFRFEGHFYENVTRHYSTTLNELHPAMRDLLNLQDFMEMAELTKLLEKTSEPSTLEKELHTNMTEKCPNITEQIPKLLAYLNIEEKEYRDLKTVAGSTLFPNRVNVKNYDVNVTTLERFVTAGLLVQKKEDGSLVFANESVACFLVSKMLVEKELDETFVQLLFQDCIGNHSLNISIPYFSSGLEIDFCASSKIKYQRLVIESYKFRNWQFFKFLEYFTTTKNIAIQNYLKKLFPENIQSLIHACVYANHYNLLETLVPLDSHASLFKSEQIVMLAVIYGGVPLVNLIINQYVQQTSMQVQNVRIKISAKKFDKDDKEVKDDQPQAKASDDDGKQPQDITLLHLATLRGDYLVVKYLLNTHFNEVKLNQPQMRDILQYCVVNTLYHSSEKVEERKRIIELLLQLCPALMHQNDHGIPFSVPNIHVDLVILLLDKGLDDEGSLQSILHFSPSYMTPQHYDQLVQALSTRGKTEVFHSTGKWKYTPLHKAVQHFELLDSTIEVFSNAKFDFNNGILSSAVTQERSAHLLEAFINAGAGFRKLDKGDWSVLHYAAFSYNVTALKYFIWRGCDVNATDSSNNTPLHVLLKYLRPLNTTHDLLQTLIQQGADVNAVGEDNQTPLSIAVEKSNKKHLDDCSLEFIRSASVI